MAIQVRVSVAKLLSVSGPIRAVVDPSQLTYVFVEGQQVFFIFRLQRSSSRIPSWGQEPGLWMESLPDGEDPVDVAVNVPLVVA